MEEHRDLTHWTMPEEEARLQWRRHRQGLREGGKDAGAGDDSREMGGMGGA